MDPNVWFTLYGQQVEFINLLARRINELYQEVVRCQDLVTHEERLVTKFTDLCFDIGEVFAFDEEVENYDARIKTFFELPEDEDAEPDMMVYKSTCVYLFNLLEEYFPSICIVQLFMIPVEVYTRYYLIHQKEKNLIRYKLCLQYVQVLRDLADILLRFRVNTYAFGPDRSAKLATNLIIRKIKEVEDKRKVIDVDLASLALSDLRD